MKIININGRNIWIVFEQLVVYNEASELYETKDEFLCYYKLSEPNDFVRGELLKNEDGFPIIFNSEQQAIEHITNNNLD